MTLLNQRPVSPSFYWAALNAAAILQGRPVRRRFLTCDASFQRERRDQLIAGDALEKHEQHVRVALPREADDFKRFPRFSCGAD